MVDKFLHIENAAHDGAFGHNPIPAPTEAQCRAGNYKMGRLSLHGLPIAIEQPRGSYRTGTDPDGKRWASRMAAHYGYINGTKGNDGDCVDCFVGFYSRSDIAYVINQSIGGKFDEHKVMLAFPDEGSARRAYLDSYERGWKGLASLIPISISQLKWWLKSGDMHRPISAENLPYEGLETMTKKVQWNKDALPYGTTIDQVLYDIRRADSGEGLLLDAVSAQEIIDDADGVLALDALVSPYAKLERRMELLRGIMERTGAAVKPVAMQITDPFKQRGVANVAVIFELSDGQTVSIYFHNPDATPNKLASSDEMISWKWLLNKKDITIVVAPERGVDLNVREVARRIMKLAEKNSQAFQRANAKRAERMQGIQSLKDEIAGLETELETAQRELEVARVTAEGAPVRTLLTDEEQAALAKREEAAHAILEGMTDEQLTSVGASMSLMTVVTLRLGRAAAIDKILENHPDDVEKAIASVVPAASAAVPDQTEPQTEKTDAEKIAAVDEAYRFTSATDEFKLWLSESVLKGEHSPFLTAKGMDEAAKRHGAEIEWGEFAGATMDSVHTVAGEQFDGGELDTLRAMKEGGKVEDGDVPSKASRDSLVERGYVERGDGFNWLTDKGKELATALDDVGLAVATLQQALDVVKTNEPINRAEGDTEQANLEAETAASIVEAIANLTEGDHEPGEPEVGATQEKPPTLDSVDDDRYVGKVKKGDQVLGRIGIADDGKAMVYVGEAGDERVKGSEGSPLMYSEEDAPEMVEALLATAQAETFAGEESQHEQADRSGTAEEQAAADAALGMASDVVVKLGGTFTADGYSGKGTIGAWSYGNATVNGETIRLAASGGGVVQVNHRPHGPDGELNLSAEQVSASILAVAPAGAAAVESDVETISGRSKKYEQYVRLIRGAVSAENLPPGFKQKLDSDTELRPGEAEDLIELIRNLNAPTVSSDNAAAADQKESDRALFQSVIAGTVPDILAPDLADSLAAAYDRNQSDPDLVMMFEQAVSAYQSAMLAATSA